MKDYSFAATLQLTIILIYHNQRKEKSKDKYNEENGREPNTLASCSRYDTAPIYRGKRPGFS